ncbi:MAG TPA: FtsQ-type POTRA domain-containing protein [Methylomirabilota bacterium]|nr:FtsQ-type POTRA domain-containing protein [Methylomirabilota bacterium]
MWFKRQQKNRRLSRRRVLDVKLRSDQVRATRMRMVTVACSILFGTLFGLYLLWRTGEWALNRFLYENSTFAIQNVEVQTDGVIAPEQLRQWSKVKPGANLIALDLAAVKRNLEFVPAIASVSIERVLPRALKIRVTERKPVAQVNIPRADGANGIAVSVFQLDADGVVMQPLDPRQCTISLSQIRNQLPVIMGLNLYQLQPGHRMESPQMQVALQLVGAFGRSPMAGLVELRRIDVSSPQVVVVTTEQGSEITFGLENLEQQLRRWRQIYDLGRQMNKNIASADLAVANNVPVRWMEMSLAPVAPKNSTPVTLRRRNV